jgi:hypothetical protein
MDAGSYRFVYYTPDSTNQDARIKKGTNTPSYIGKVDVSILFMLNPRDWPSPSSMTITTSYLSEIFAFRSGSCYHLLKRLLGLALTKVSSSRSIYDCFMTRRQQSRYLSILNLERLINTDMTHRAKHNGAGDQSWYFIIKVLLFFGGVLLILINPRQVPLPELYFDLTPIVSPHTKAIITHSRTLSLFCG